jgi:hypothetical protein
MGIGGRTNHDGIDSRMIRHASEVSGVFGNLKAFGAVPRDVFLRVSHNHQVRIGKGVAEMLGVHAADATGADETDVEYRVVHGF